MKATEENVLIKNGPIIEAIQEMIYGAVPVTGEYESGEDEWKVADGYIQRERQQ